MSDIKSTDAKTQETRRPVQERSAARVAKVLAVAERMLAEVGAEKTSIPAIAEMAAVPRAAIYPFFPDKYAIFSRLSQLHMEQMRHKLARSAAERARSWQEWVEVVIKTTAKYYNANPSACVLLLRGSFTDEDHSAHAAKNETIADQLRRKAESLGQLPNLPAKPDAAAIAVELGLACMKYGYALEKRVSPSVCREATRAVTAYLMAWDVAKGSQ